MDMTTALQHILANGESIAKFLCREHPNEDDPIILLFKMRDDPATRDEDRLAIQVALADPTLARSLRNAQAMVSTEGFV